MEPLENFIKKNREQFDLEEPKNGHYERFKKRLKSSKKIVLTNYKLFSAAAAIILLLGVLWLFNRPADKSPDTTIECELSENMKLCYADKMYEIAQEIYVLSERLDPHVRREIENEVFNILERNDCFDEYLPADLSEKESQTILSDYYNINLRTLYSLAEVLRENK